MHTVIFTLALKMCMQRYMRWCGCGIMVHHWAHIFNFYFLTWVLSKFMSISILPLTNYNLIKWCVCIFTPVSLTLQSKSHFLKRKKSRRCLKTAFNKQEFKMHMRSNSCTAVSTMDVGCLPPNSGDLRKAETGHQRKIYSNSYKNVSFATWQPPATMPSMEQTPFSSTPRKSIKFQPWPGRKVLFADCKLQAGSVQQWTKWKTL